MLFCPEIEYPTGKNVLATVRRYSETTKKYLLVFDQWVSKPVWMERVPQDHVFLPLPLPLPRRSLTPQSHTESLPVHNHPHPQPEPP